MGTALDVTKFFWDIFKDGAKLSTSSTRVNAIPQGSTVQDFQDWQGPVSYAEHYEELSFLFNSDICNFTLTPSWQYNGQYIANFTVDVDGTLDVLSSLDVRAETSEATYDDDDVAQLPYRINVTFHNVTGGTRQTTFKGIARGDGGGLNVE
ncbi:hypothetical protein [Paraburkholderia atlantica]|uniref:Uncharacterized protein n=1 Tax=Paraburkholderia atlantica TaxID=2654982 RepID=D5WNH2_PARAM|nr:hypothetical protein [Paraburkholderia atlantica]ADG20851.1 hypothetical protein BC1002_7101 [Paraburkholderia atlantica]MBB5510935.1 hypothetical protein [Paraburkholderia atlantica]